MPIHRVDTTEWDIPIALWKEYHSILDMGLSPLLIGEVLIRTVTDVVCMNIFHASFSSLIRRVSVMSMISRRLHC